jgi:hypothetical protein
MEYKINDLVLFIHENEYFKKGNVYKIVRVETLGILVLNNKYRCTRSDVINLNFKQMLNACIH